MGMKLVWSARHVYLVGWDRWLREMAERPPAALEKSDRHASLRASQVHQTTWLQMWCVCNRVSQSVQHNITVGPFLTCQCHIWIPRPSNSYVAFVDSQYLLKFAHSEQIWTAKCATRRVHSYVHSFIRSLKNHSWQTATDYTWYSIVIIVKQSNMNL